MQVQAPEHLNNVEHATMKTMIFLSVPHELQDQGQDELQDQGQEELHQEDVPEHVVEEDLRQNVTART